jgi:hypothetical protein
MVQAFDRLVGRRAGLALAPALLAGCQCLAVPLASCPEVTSAEAWVNRMPSIGDVPTKLIVSLRVEGDAPWMLTPVMAGAEGDLTLDLVVGGNSVPGTVAYRQKQPAPMPKTIRITCQGNQIASIDEILIVQ